MCEKEEGYFSCRGMCILKLLQKGMGQHEWKKMKAVTVAKT